jgi:hypothetical protein
MIHHVPQTRVKLNKVTFPLAAPSKAWAAEHCCFRRVFHVSQPAPSTRSARPLLAFLSGSIETPARPGEAGHPIRETCGENEPPAVCAFGPDRQFVRIPAVIGQTFESRDARAERASSAAFLSMLQCS